MIKAVCVVMWNEDGKRLLAIATHHRPGEWTLPGGSLDEGESPREAAVRELREETGVDAEVAAEPCHVGIASSSGILCAAYVVVRWNGEPRDSEEGHVAWVDPERVFDTRYEEFNRAAVAKARGIGCDAPNPDRTTS